MKINTIFLHLSDLNIIKNGTKEFKRKLKQKKHFFLFKELRDKKINKFKPLQRYNRKKCMWKGWRENVKDN